MARANTFYHIVKAGESSASPPVESPDKSSAPAPENPDESSASPSPKNSEETSDDEEIFEFSVFQPDQEDDPFAKAKHYGPVSSSKSFLESGSRLILI
jgi:hypothetical protein